MAIFRRTAQQADYVWAISLTGKPVDLGIKRATPGELTVSIDKATVIVSTSSPSVRIE